ncbi:MAG: hypothetical protein IJE01_05540 [Clostridia bacterium]|nr:hypothetical protein [Clostridia bacterium]
MSEKSVNSKNDNFHDRMTPSANSYITEPEDSFEMVNKYGTYEIQPTNSTENAFPKIAQGLAKEENRRVKKKGSSKWEYFD